ncbi:hypothetical protein HD597_011315 [Nonomuraea thailandensis]|uniref:Uncharacterized protein n=1 Tax=Nonomuraea thailandensis TaxID=1188745 RepID=A0A9X2GUT2_9ACTN|nr:hypothetical protein [Nonomuraea thailandensis]MCP2364295.1 hypothetical protein [Nonomuraea thailandensis]
MSYEWTGEVVQYPQNKVNFSVNDGTFWVDLMGNLSGEEDTPADAALLMGKIKDALEAANLNVGAIYLSGICHQTLTEI